MPKSASSGPLRFRALFWRCVALLKKHQKTILTISIVIGVIVAFQQLVAQMIPNKIGLNGQVTNQLDFSQVSSGLVALFALLKTLSSVASLIAGFMYWILVIEEKGDLQKLFRGAYGIILPMLGIYLWSFIQSYAWIAAVGGILIGIGAVAHMPVVGALGAIALVAGAACMFVFGPRYIAAPVLYLEQKKGIKQSVTQSYNATKGYWGKIMGNGILFGLSMWLVIMVVAIVVGILAFCLAFVTALLGPGGMWANIIVFLILSFLMGAVQSATSFLGTAFIKELSETILQNPRK